MLTCSGDGVHIGGAGGDIGGDVGGGTGCDMFSFFGGTGGDMVTVIGRGGTGGARGGDMVLLFF